MKKFVIIIGIGLLAMTLQAQQGYHYGVLKGGTGNGHSLTGTLGLDVVTRYHNSLELSFNFLAADNLKDEYLLGIQYKPVLSRARNTALKWRMGVLGGTNLSQFVGGLQTGWELQHSLVGGFDLLLVNHYGYCFGSELNWRIGMELGFRFTL